MQTTMNASGFRGHAMKIFWFGFLFLALSGAPGLQAQNACPPGKSRAILSAALICEILWFERCPIGPISREAATALTCSQRAMESVVSPPSPAFIST